MIPLAQWEALSQDYDDLVAETDSLRTTTWEQKDRIEELEKEVSRLKWELQYHQGTSDTSEVNEQP